MFRLRDVILSVVAVGLVAGLWLSKQKCKSANHEAGSKERKLECHAAFPRPGGRCFHEHFSKFHLN